MKEPIELRFISASTWAECRTNLGMEGNICKHICDYVNIQNIKGTQHNNKKINEWIRNGQWYENSHPQIDMQCLSGENVQYR